MAELKAWCRPLGLDVSVNPYQVRIVWADPETGEEYTVASEKRPPTGNGSSLDYSAGFPVRKRVSVATTCKKLAREYFLPSRAPSRWMSWTRVRSKNDGVYELETAKTVSLKLPRSSSPEELELKLAAAGWTGNPFGRSAPPKRKAV